MEQQKQNPYLKPMIWAAVFFALGIVMTKIYRFESIKELFRDLSDCFLLPGVLLAGGAAISWAGTFGTFDMLAYGSRSFFGIFIRPLAQDLPSHFYDYRKQRDEKGRHWSKETLFVGLISIGISGLMLIVYFLL
jgi:hypothetical protein